MMMMMMMENDQWWWWCLFGGGERRVGVVRVVDKQVVLFCDARRLGEKGVL